MALVHSLVDDSQIHSAQLRAFLHQRARQWKYTDLTLDPLHCTDLPEDYEPDQTSPNDTTVMKSAQHVVWHQNLPKDGPLSSITNALNRIKLAVTPASKKTIDPVVDAPDEWASGLAPVCPTFAGGSNSVGECIFTNAAVQNAVLAFFEEVAQDPEHYRNPAFKVYTEAPQPTPDNPLALLAEEDTETSFLPVKDEVTPEQEELSTLREKLVDLNIALSAVPASNTALVPGRDKVDRKINIVQAKIEELETKALGNGGLVAGEVSEKHQTESWKPQVEGPKVPFAGTMVDSDLLKAAGLVDTANEGLEEDGEDKEESAFV
jgi:hypothetical protein